MGNNLPIISDFLRRFESGEVAGQPLHWQFAVEIEYALFAANTPQVPLKIEKLRAERLQFRQEQLGRTHDEQEIARIESEMQQLLNASDFNITAEDGKGRSARVLENLVHCEINDVLCEQGMIRQRFGTGEYGTGWFDVARVGEVASDGGRDAAKVIDEHKQILSVIKDISEKHKLQVRVYETHLNFSLSREENGALRHLVEIGTPEALDLYGRALGGMSKALVDAQPLMNLLGKSPPCISAHEIACKTSTHRGDGALRNSRGRTEHRSLGTEPDIEEVITLIVGGAAQAMASDEGKFAELGLKKGEIVDVPVYEDNTGKNEMLKGVVKAMQLDKATGRLSFNADYYHMFRMSIVREVFNGFEDIKEEGKRAGHDSNDLMILEKSTYLFFEGLQLNKDGTVDIEQQRKNISNAKMIPDLLKEHYTEKVLTALQALKLVGSYKSVRHEGYPTAFGGENEEQNIRDMADSPVLKGIYGSDMLKQKVSFVFQRYVGSGPRAPLAKSLGL